MRALETNLLDWQKRYETEEACVQAAHAATLARRVPLPVLRA